MLLCHSDMLLCKVFYLSYGCLFMVLVVLKDEALSQS